MDNSEQLYIKLDEYFMPNLFASMQNDNILSDNNVNDNDDINISDNILKIGYYDSFINKINIYNDFILSGNINKDIIYELYYINELGEKLNYTKLLDFQLYKNEILPINNSVVAPKDSKYIGIFNNDNLIGGILLKNFKKSYDKKLYSFGLLCNTLNPKINLENCLDFFNSENVKLVSNLGDLSNNKLSLSINYFPVISKYNYPVFCCKGNKDSSWAPYNKNINYWAQYTFPNNINDLLINYQYENIGNFKYNPDLFIYNDDTNNKKITKYVENENYFKGKYGVKINNDGFIEMYGYSYDKKNLGDYTQDWDTSFVDCFLPKITSLKPRKKYYVVLEIDNIETLGDFCEFCICSGPFEGSGTGQFNYRHAISLKALKNQVKNNRGLYKFEVISKSSFNSNVKFSLRTYLNPGNNSYGAIKFRIALYKNDVNLNTYKYGYDYNNVKSVNPQNTNNFYAITPNNDVYIYFSMDTTKYNEAYNYSNLLWLNKILDKYRDKRTFVFMNLFIPDKSGNLGYDYFNKSNSFFDKNKWLSGKPLEMIHDLNNYYKNSIWFSGNSPWEWEMDKYDLKENICNTNGSAWTIHVPSWSDPKRIESGEDNNIQVISGSTQIINQAQCGLVDIYKKYIEIHGISFIQNVDSNKVTYKYISNANYRIYNNNIFVQSNENLLFNKYIKSKDYNINEFLYDDYYYTIFSPNIKVVENYDNNEYIYSTITFGNPLNYPINNGIMELKPNQEDVIFINCDDDYQISNYKKSCNYVILHITYLSFEDFDGKPITLTDEEKEYFGFKFINSDNSENYTLNDNDVIPILNHNGFNGIKFGKSKLYNGRTNLVVKIKFNLEFINIPS